MSKTSLCLIAFGAAVLAGCGGQSFTDAYTEAALSSNPPDPEKQMDADIRDADNEALSGVDTSGFQYLE